MRIITWNCKGAFHRKHDFAVSLRPDILIVPECEKISSIAQSLGSAPVRSFEWFGSNPQKGLAVISYGDYSVDVHPGYDPSHEWIVPLSVSGPTPFILFAVWTVPLGKWGGRYVRPLLAALETYKNAMNGSEIVWAGDFNSNYIFDKPGRRFKFCDFVAILREQGLHSVYHHHRGCEHGEEPDKTFYLHHNAEKGYHIDYVFASERLLPHGVDVSIGSHADWAKRSDHAPLVCDFLSESATPS
ncbi:MAG: endonuclease/exonuclease/phosphatase family protein [Chthoniobacteraceae bacterium]